MTGRTAVRLDGRGVLALSGEDADDFLQGLITNDLRRLAPDRALWAALLTPQGRVLFDFGLVRAEDTLLLDVERARAGELARRLALYRLRARVAICERSEAWTVLAVPGPEAAERFALPRERGRARRLGEALVFVDPRSIELGVRALVPADRFAAFLLEHGLELLPEERFEVHRIRLGVPEGARDLPPERALPLEANFDALDIVSFTKGCFVGQEVTARMEHRGLVRKRLVPVRFLGPPPAEGAPVRLEDREVGEIRRVAGEHGLALLRAEAFGRAGLRAQETELLVEPPAWLVEELQP